jgi:phosphopantothenoylcysteine decarboxylase / phosphopantothenate---cysteine ligase
MDYPALTGKKILLGVCGSIAAYKSAYIIRYFIKNGAEVKVVMTKSATDFISPLTLSTLSKNKVFTDFVSEHSEWNNHVELGLWANVMLIAPLSANTLAKLANGFCDNILSAVYLSARCSVILAPAMDEDMWKHPATQKNIERVKDFGNQIISVQHGELASGLTGDGRMQEPEEIVKAISNFFSAEKKTLAGKKILITAGPTVEPIDPVRFISNHSTGKMGIALAESAAKRGGEVTLILGPTSLFPKNNSIKTIGVQTAEDMFAAAKKNAAENDIIILSAAVADFKPAVFSNKKIKKNGHEQTLLLHHTPDIAEELGKQKKENQFLVGFALETDHEMENARKKISAKNLDAIVLNSLQDEGAGFHFDTNRITILSKKNEEISFPLKSKTEVADDILDFIISHHA